MYSASSNKVTVRARSTLGRYLAMASILVAMLRLLGVSPIWIFAARACSGHEPRGAGVGRYEGICCL
jgi:hypothetical protein